MPCCFESSRELIDAAESHAAHRRPELVAHSLEDLACIAEQLGLRPLAAAAGSARAAIRLTSDETHDPALLVSSASLRAALAAAEAEWAATDLDPAQRCPRPPRLAGLVFSPPIPPPALPPIGPLCASL